MDQENRLVSTLEYEGIWEGIKDYTYLNTLDILLQKKGNSAAGIRIRKSLDRLLKDFNEKNSLVAVVNPGYSMSETAILNFTNTDANALRFLLAQWIMELEKA